MTYPSFTVEHNITLKEEQIPESLKTVFFRILQEAMTNAGKHSDADRIRISLQNSDGRFALIIEDNGRGFNIEEAQIVGPFGKGLGLSSMRERAKFSGGNLFVKSEPGKGTRIEARWPSQAA